MGNAALARAHAGRVQAKLAVSHVEDPLEREAEAFSARVVAQAPLRQPVKTPETTSDTAATSRLAIARRSEARAVGTQPTAPPVKTVAREEADATPDGPATATAEAAGPEVTPSLESFITGISGGDPLAEGLREKIEPVLGADLSGVRVHGDAKSAAAAAQLQARAFTYGKDIFLGAGESPADLALMAHESTHAVQQGAVEVYRLFDFIGDAAKEGVARLAREIPGYTLLSQIAGQDLITNAPVKSGRAEFIQALLEHGPFAGAIGPVLQSLDALDKIFDLISARLRDHNLTWDRIGADMTAAWNEMDWTKGSDANVAVAERYINKLLADVTAFVRAVVDDVIEAVKAAAIKFAEPLVQTPKIKPYWDLGVKIFHHNPLTGEEVDAPTIDILRDLLKLLGKEETLQQMEERGTLAETAKWLDEQFETFRGLRNQAEQLVKDVIEAISPVNLGNLVQNVTALADRAYALLLEFKTFAETVIGKILELVKKALLSWLAEHANKVPGFYLLTVILGKNPFTQEKVERNATNLIQGFIKLLPNGEEVYKQLAEAGTIEAAASRIEGAMARLNISWELVTGTFKAIWDGLKLADLVQPIEAFDRIVDQFGDPLERIIEFAATVLQVVIELILKLMKFPTELVGNIIENAMSAIEDIKKDPIQFLKNVVLALKQGFLGFFDNIGTYLLQGLTDWLFRGVRSLGIKQPEDVSLKSIITLVIQVSGVTEESLWTKLGKRIGEEKVAKIRKAIEVLGQAWAFIKDVSERGIDAVWEFIQGQLTNLWDMILGAAKDWIMKEVVKKVTVRLMSMLDPTGVMAVVNSAVAFFDTVRSVVEYIGEILQIIDRYVGTIAAVAKGDVGPGAAMLERGLAQAVPVALGFIANLLHMDDVPEKIRDIIVDLRLLIDQAIDWLFDKAMELGKAALEALGLGDKDPSAVRKQVIDIELAGISIGHRLKNDGPNEDLVFHSDDVPLEQAATRNQQLHKLFERYVAAHTTRLGLISQLAGEPPSEAQAVQLEQLRVQIDGIVAEISTIARAFAVVPPTPDTDPAQVPALVAQAALDLAMAKSVGGPVTTSEPQATVAAGGGTTKREGGGRLSAARRNPAAALRNLEANSARWGGLKEPTRQRFEELASDDAAFARMLDEGGIGDDHEESPLTLKYAVSSFDEQLAHFEQTGNYIPMRHRNDTTAMGPGSTYLAHAEKILRDVTRTKAIGVSRPQCQDCQVWFRAEARSAGIFIVVAGDDAVRVFTPQGTITSPSDYPPQPAGSPAP